MEFDRYTWLGKGNLRSRGSSLWDRIEIEPGSKHSYVGSHRHEGVIALSGPSARRGRTIAAEIADVAPTILYLLSQPLPTDLDGASRDGGHRRRRSSRSGRPSTRIWRASPSARPRATHAADEESVEERLRSLGYLE